MTDVTVVSAGDRCFWLLDQLCQTDLKVSVYDMSSDLDMSLPEREGPFGIFLPEGMDDLQKKYLSGDQFHVLSEGFCVLSSQGPLEFRGPLTSFLMDVKKEFYFCHSCLVENAENSLKLLKKQKEVNWLCNLAARLSSVYQNPDNLSCLPLFSEYLLRESSFRYIQEVNHFFQEQGLSYISDKLEDIFVKDNHIHLKFHGREIETRFLVWALSGLETKKCFPETMNILFPGWQKPVKNWKRFSLLWDKASFQKVIPGGLVVVPDPEKNIYEDHNLISLKSNAFSTYTDLWVLSDFRSKAKKNHLAGIIKHLKSLLPGFLIQEEPQSNGGYGSEYFVVYENSVVREKMLSDTHSHLLHLNPESTGFSDAYSLMKYSQQLLTKVLQV